MSESNLVVSKNARSTFGSNLLPGKASEYPSASILVDFSTSKTIEDVSEGLHWLEANGYHLINDREWVFSSHELATLVDSLIAATGRGDKIDSVTFRLLTRTANLRDSVIKLLGDRV